MMRPQAEGDGDDERDRRDNDGDPQSGAKPFSEEARQ
jgi:hypothetical protein